MKELPNYTCLVDNAPGSLLERLEEAYTSGGQRFVFFQGQEDYPINNLKDRLNEVFKDIYILDTTIVGDKPIVVAECKKPLQEIAKHWTARYGGQLSPPEPEKKKGIDYNKARGWAGIIAQVLMAISGGVDSDPVRKAKKEGKSHAYQTKEGKTKLFSAGVSLLGNGINVRYGTQKNEDKKRLEFAKRIVNSHLSINNAEDAPYLPKKDEQLIPEEAKEKTSWMQRNSIKFGSAVKIVSKLALLVSGKSDLKLSGGLSLFSKFITVIGLDEDPYRLDDDQRPITKARRNSNFVSSLFDWTSTFSLFVGSFLKKGKSNEKKKWYKIYDFDNSETRWEKGKFWQTNDVQWWQLASATMFAFSLFLKSLAPFTQKKIDTEELLTHTSLALAVAGKDRMIDEVTDMTARLYEAWELPEVHEELGFARTFTHIAGNLEQYHDIRLSKKTASQEEVPVTTDTLNKQDKEPEVAGEPAPSVDGEVLIGAAVSSVADRILESRPNPALLSSTERAAKEEGVKEAELAAFG